ncbi:hypothetical protein RIF29_24526 [Crotalaria pallida]|uniref:soluble epoxide hydrolase n=1 Tax=Crotalaria pallida TaxID=3830 RepID=A0AAN9EKS7_CROPI
MHRTVQVNGIKMHVAEQGQGPVVLFLHGFPEIWYTWRHQMEFISSKGYRAVAPDLRGYGDTEAPALISNYTAMHLVGDIVGLIDSLCVDQVYLVAHDWGATIGWYLSLFRPDRIKAYVSLSVPYLPRNPKIKPVEEGRANYGENYYICRFQEPGKVEADYAKAGTEEIIKRVLTNHRPGPPIFPKAGVSSLPKVTGPLPSWLTQKDVDYYVSKFNKSGFTGAFNYYRNVNLNWELLAPWTGAKVKVPVKFITGALDVTYTSPGIKEYVHGGDFKKNVPYLEDIVIQEGVAHFNNEEASKEINNYIYEFIKKF